jgi:hypothetical protein
MAAEVCADRRSSAGLRSSDSGQGDDQGVPGRRAEPVGHRGRDVADRAAQGHQGQDGQDAVGHDEQPEQDQQSRAGLPEQPENPQPGRAGQPLPERGGQPP